MTERGMTFPIEREEINGEEFIIMDSDIFYNFFMEMSKYIKTDKERVKFISNRYLKAKKIKRKRIRVKKEKQALNLMYYELYNASLKKSEVKS